MTVEQEVAGLTVSVNELTEAVLFKVDKLDIAVASAEASAIAAAASAAGTTPGTGGGTVDNALLTNEVNRATAAEYLKADKLTTYTKLEVTAIIQGLIGNAPATLDTFHELAAKMLVDESGVAALVTEIGKKAPALHTHAPATPTADGFMTAAEKIKLAGIADGASAGGIVANTLAGYGITDAYTKTQIDTLISVLSGGGGVADWATITNKPNFGTAAQSNVGDFATPLSVTNEATRATQAEGNKVDKITGYSLTKNDFTDILKAKLDSFTAVFTTGLKSSYDNTITWISTNGTNLISHLSNTSNPHNVTKTQIGLPNVDNTSDANKPVSALQATADALVLSTAKAYTDTTVSTEVSERNTAITAAINALLNGAPDALNTLMEISAKFTADESIVSALITTVGGKIATADIIDNLLTNVATKPLSAAQGVFLKSLIDGLTTSLGTKVDKAVGYSLTKNDFTDLLKSKLDSITAFFTVDLKLSYDNAVAWISNHANVDNTSDLLKPPSTAQIILNNSYAAKMNNPMLQQGDIIYAGPDGVPTRLPIGAFDQTLSIHPAGILSWQDKLAGQNATVSIGTITTIAAGGTATVTNVGDSLNAILNFQIPQGPAGVPGLAGSNSLLIAPLEQWNVVNAGATGIINIDISTASVWFYTLPATTSFVLNVRGNSATTFASKMAIGQSCTVVFANTSGSTPYFPSMFTIDGVQFFPQWSGGLSPNSGNSNSTDMYAYVIVRTGASAYKIYANQTKFA